MVGSLETQSVAKRWDNNGKSAQVSCFVSENAKLNPKQLVNLEHAVDAALKDISIVPENDKQKLWVDAYSAHGELTVESNKTSVKGKAIGVGGDFFLFHPLMLQSGSFFSDDDLMQDYIVLDEDAAWQLFGSNDIEGMQVTINGIPHIVKAVIKRDTGRMNEKAGNGQITFYVSYDSLTKYGAVEGVDTYEIVMPNPISGFALKTIKEKIGIDETNIELVDNTSRYTTPALWKVFLEFGTRSMNQKAVIYPYWENVARGYEDVLSIFLILKAVFLLIPIVIGIGYARFRYKNRTWNMKQLIVKSTEKVQEIKWSELKNALSDKRFGMEIKEKLRRKVDKKKK
jgi:hypothetical protein